MKVDLSCKGKAAQNVQKEIRELLERFQEGYTNRDLSILGTYVEELFAKDEDALVIGTGDTEWFLGINEIKKLIQSDWKYWGDVFINIDEAFISAEGNTAWIYTDSMLLSRKDGSEEKNLNRILGEIRETIDEDGEPREKVLKILQNTSYNVLQLERGSNFIWPFRLCAVVVKQGGKWLFHQMHFSFPTVMPPDVRHNDINKYEKQRLPRGNATARIQNEIRKVLERFQDGYTRRDTSILNDFMEELFVKDEDLLVVGTGNDELCLGFEEVLELIEGDWLYWGDVKIFTEGAVVSSNGDAAWIAADAVLVKTMTEEQFSSGVIDSVINDMKGDMPNRGKLLHAVEGITHVLYHVDQGDSYIRPFRFTALLVRREGTWKFKNMQFSHPTTNTPDVRMIDGKAYFGFIEV